MDFEKRGVGLFIKKKKGQFFEVDALIAIGILVIGLAYIRSLSVDAPQITRNEGYSEESAKLLRTLTVGDLDPDVIENLTTSDLGYLTELNFTVAKQIAIYHFEDYPGLASNLTRVILDSLIPSDFGYQVRVRSGDSSQVVYQRGDPSGKGDFAVSRTMITGLQQTKPVIGRFVRLYLANAKNTLKRYEFFGGYVGQGNMTFTMDLPPTSFVEEVYFEGSAGEDIAVHVNGVQCGTITKSADEESITEVVLPCENEFGIGENNISFRFLSDDLTNHSIGGGFFEVSYNTEEPVPESNRRYFPEIDGRINIYDSVFFDGNVSEDTFKINLSFVKSDDSLLEFTFGNETLMQVSSPQTYNLVYTEENFSSDVYLNDSSNQNIPIRFGPPIIGRGNGDIVWITDLSNSMNECGTLDKDYNSSLSQCGLADSMDSDIEDYWEKPYVPQVWNEIASFDDERLCMNSLPDSIGHEDISTGLIAWWKLNENSDRFNFTDETGNYEGHCGRYSCPRRVENGIFKNARSFHEDNISILNFNIPPKGTIAFWMRADEFEENTDKRIMGSDDVFEIRYKDASGSNQLRVVNELYGPGSASGLESNQQILPDIWYHVAFTYDSAAPLRQIYINGELDNSVSSTPSTPPTPAELDIGIRTGRDDDDEYYSGDLDDIRFYDIVLTKEQIQELMNTSIESTNRTEITKRLESVMSDFTFEVDFDFVSPSGLFENSLQVILSEDGHRKEILVGDINDELTFVHDGTVYPPAELGVTSGQLKIEKYGNNLKVLINDNVLIDETGNFGGVQDISISGLMSSHICLDSFRLYDAVNTKIGENGYGIYYDDSLPGMYYGDVQHTLWPTVTHLWADNREVPNCGDYGELCYCSEDADTLETVVVCKNGHSLYDSCCDLGYNQDSGMQLDACVDVATDCDASLGCVWKESEWSTRETRNGECDPLEYANEKISTCYTFCADYGSTYEQGDTCSTATANYNCAAEDKDCEKTDHFTNPSYDGSLCIVNTESRAGDEDMDPGDFATLCKSYTLNVDNPISSPYEQTVCDGDCNPPYEYCKIFYTKIGGPTTSCVEQNNKEHCQYSDYNPELPYQKYSLEFKGYQKWTQKNCLDVKNTVFWAWYQAGTQSCIQWRDSNDDECRNIGATDISLFDTFPGEYPQVSVSYAKGAFSRYFEVSNVNNYDWLRLNVMQANQAAYCLLNGQNIFLRNVLHPQTGSPSEDKDLINFINTSHLVEGTNQLLCIDYTTNSDIALRLQLNASVGGEEYTIIDYEGAGNWTDYKVQDRLCGKHSKIENSLWNNNCPFGVEIDSCRNFHPWTPHQRLDISYVLANATASNIQNVDEIVERMRNTFGGSINKKYILNDHPKQVPEDFWDSADILIIDMDGGSNTQLMEEIYPWADTLKENITQAVDNGKYVIAGDPIGVTVGQLNQKSFPSYTLGGQALRNTAGKLISNNKWWSSNINNVKPFMRLARDNLYSGYSNGYGHWAENFAAHYYSVIHELWEYNDVTAMCVPEFCVPLKEEYCETCDYIRIKKAKELDTSHVQDLMTISGNRVSMIGYGTNASCGPQMNGFTSNASYALSLIEDYEAECGQTCVSCSLYQAMQNLNRSAVDPFEVMPLYLKSGIVSGWDMEGSNYSVMRAAFGSNDGEPQNDANQTADGYFGKGFTFDGEGDYANTTILSADQPSENMTVLMWVKLNHLVGTQGIIGQRSGHSLYAANGVLSLETYTTGGLPRATLSDSTTLDYNKWYFIAFTYDDSTGNQTLYRDAEPVASNIDVPNSGLGLQTIQQRWVFGALDNGAPTQFFNGTLDNVLIYNRVLSQGELRALVDTGDRNRYVVLMSDGDANYYWNETQQKSFFDPVKAKDQAINYSARLCHDFNATLFTVAFGSLEGSATLQQMAQANHNASEYCSGVYFEGLNEHELDEAFTNISTLFKFDFQSIDFGLSSAPEDHLSGKSYIEFDTVKPDPEIPNGTVKFSSRTVKFSNFSNVCKPTIDLSGFSWVDNARVTSYSGRRWTSGMKLNDATIFDLYRFGKDLNRIGDPFVLGVPQQNLPGDRIFTFGMNISEDDQGLLDECSSDNRMLYDAYIPRSFAAYSNILELSEGCVWEVEFSDESIKTIRVPVDYNGSKTCKYQIGAFEDEHSDQDAADVAMFNLLSSLDIDGNGDLEVSIDTDDLEVDAQTIKRIPYLWGPALIEIGVWK